MHLPPFLRVFTNRAVVLFFLHARKFSNVGEMTDETSIILWICMNTTVVKHAQKIVFCPTNTTVVKHAVNS